MRNQINSWGSLLRAPMWGNGIRDDTTMPHRQRKGGEGDILAVKRRSCANIRADLSPDPQARPKTRIVKSWSVGCGVAVTLKVDWSDTTSSAGAACQPQGHCIGGCGVI